MNVGEELSVRHAIPAAIKLIAEKYGFVALLTKVKGYNAVVTGNLLGAKRRLAMAMGVKESDLAEVYLDRRKKPIKPSPVNNGPVRENILSGDIDIIKTIPVLTHHEKNAEPYITTGVIISKDPETENRGMGIHRIQVKGPRTLGIFLNNLSVAAFLKKTEKRREPLEIAIASGLDPVSLFSSVIRAPEGIDKFDIAGGLSGHPVSLIKCESIDLEVPVSAEFILEGRVLPGRREPEDPFGKSSGYYFSNLNPVAEIQVITHRDEPIYHALMLFAGEEEGLIDFSFQMEHENLCLNSIPGLKNVSFANLEAITVAQVAKQEKGDGVFRIIKQLFDCGMSNKVIVDDDDVNIHNNNEAWWAISTRLRPDHDVIIEGNMPGLGLDASSTQTESLSPGSKVLVTKTSKIGLDATKPLGEPEKFERIRVPPDMRKRVEAIIK